MTNKYPRPLTKNVKKFKFALTVDTVGKVAEFANVNNYPNVSEALEDILESYFSYNEVV